MKVTKSGIVCYTTYGRMCIQGSHWDQKKKGARSPWAVVLPSTRTRSRQFWIGDVIQTTRRIRTSVPVLPRFSHSLIPLRFGLAFQTSQDMHVVFFTVSSSHLTMKWRSGLQLICY